MGKKKPNPNSAGGAAGQTRSRGLTPDVQSLARVRIWQIQAVRDLLFVAAVIALLWFGYALRAVTVPLLVALLLAYLFEPMIARLAARPGWSRPRVVGGLLAAVTLAVLVVLALLTPLVVGQAAHLIHTVKDGTLRERLSGLAQYIPEEQESYYEQFLDLLPSGTGPQAPAEASGADVELQAAGDETPVPGEPVFVTEERVRELIALESHRLEPASADGEGDLFDLARGGAGTIVRVLGLVVEMGMLAFLIPFYFYFFSLWYPNVVTFSRELLPRKNRKRTLELLDKMDRVVSGFVRGRIVISVVMGVLLWIGWLICGVPYSLLLGVVVGIFCAVPYLGGIGIPAAIALNFLGHMGDPGNEGLWWLWLILWPTVVFAIVQLIEGYVLTPLIAGKATNLDPVTIIVVVLAGGSVLGIYGMLLAIPVAACGRILLTDVVLVRVREWVEGRVDDPLPIDKH